MQLRVSPRWNSRKSKTNTARFASRSNTWKSCCAAGKILALIRDDLNEWPRNMATSARTELALDVVTEFEESDLVARRRNLDQPDRAWLYQRVPATPTARSGAAARASPAWRPKTKTPLSISTPPTRLDHILFFTDQGKVYAERAYMIPEAARGGKGTLINAFLALQPEEYITAITSVSTFEDAKGYFVLCTHRGRISASR